MMIKDINNAIPTIVVIDDSGIVHAQFQRSIENLDIELNLMSFFSAAEAMDYLQSNRSDLIFLDILIRDKNGITFLAELRKLNIHQSTCVIMITSKDYAQDRKLANELGALEFLIKPIPIKAIAATILKYIS